MYHVFVVHSYITHLVAERVVEHERLEGSSVVFLTARNFSPARARYRCVPIDISPNPETFPRQRNVLDSWRRLRAWDRFLEGLTGGEPFHFYTPLTGWRSHQVIKTSPLCAGFSFLEEGLNSYCTREEIEAIHPTQVARFWDKVGYRNRIGNASFFDEGHTKAYGTTRAAFPGLAHAVILEDVFSGGEEQDVSGVENVLVFDSLTVYQRLRLESLLVAVRRLMDALRAEGAKSIHYKFHPAQLGTREVPVLESLLRESEPSIHAERLPDQVCLETLAGSRPDVRFFVNLSSSGLYAALKGCPVFSYARWVAEAEPRFVRDIERVPRVFQHEVPFLGASPQG